MEYCVAILFVFIVVYANICAFNTLGNYAVILGLLDHDKWIILTHWDSFCIMFCFALIMGHVRGSYKKED